MNDVTTILSAMDRGDVSAASELLPLVYEELRRLATARLARETPGQTLQPTALVHEAYVRLVDHSPSQKFDSRGHFMAAAAESMRRILVDRARQKARPKHGGDRQRVELESSSGRTAATADDVVAIHELLDRFEEQHPQHAQIVKLRYFVGMSLVEAADAMGISRATASRHWTFAKAWLANELH